MSWFTRFLDGRYELCTATSLPASVIDLPQLHRPAACNAARWLAVLLLAASIGNSRAEYALLSGMFHGTEPYAEGLQDTICGVARREYAYSVQPLSVSITGVYTLVTVGGLGVYSYAALYSGEFDPSNPAQNRLTGVEWDWTGELTMRPLLVASETYQLVVSPYCSHAEPGIWALAVDGPGMVHSPATAELDAFTRITVPGTAEGVTISPHCQAQPFAEQGPIRLARGGRYHFSHLSNAFGTSVCAFVYSAPFDPAQPQAHLVADLTLATWPYGHAELASDQDYYLVIQPWSDSEIGVDREFLVLLSPTGTVTVDPVLSGSWYDPATPGQGFFIDVLGRNEQVFLGWFTFDLAAPAGTAELGDPGHRWFTALGTAEGNRVNLRVESTRDGAFNQAEPQVHYAAAGFMGLEFLDCRHARLGYELIFPGLTRQGQVSLERLSGSAAQACQRLLENRPARPGIITAAD